MRISPKELLDALHTECVRTGNCAQYLLETRGVECLETRLAVKACSRATDAYLEAFQRIFGEERKVKEH